MNMAATSRVPASRPVPGGMNGPHVRAKGVRRCEGEAATDARAGVLGFGFGLVGFGVLIAIASFTPLEPTKGVLQSVMASDATLRFCGAALFLAAVVALFSSAATVTRKRS